MDDAAFALMFVATIFSGVFLIFMAMRQRSESLERQHRERMAMIERGQIPPPLPTTFRRGSSTVAMSLGIIIIGLGLGLMLIIGLAAGEAGVGVGVGGAIVILGLAFIVRSLVVRPAENEPEIRP